MPAEATYTYSQNPDTDTKDAVRFLLSDTNGDGLGFMLSDQEILYCISQEGGALRAAALGAEQIAASFSGPRNISEKRVGDLLIKFGSAGKGINSDWYDVAAALRRRAAMNVIPYAGGVSASDKVSNQDDMGVTHPAFRRGQFDPAVNGYQEGGAIGSTWYPST